MDQGLLRSYLATIYDFPSPNGIVRASLDGDTAPAPGALPDVLTRPFAVLTAYNPRSMLLPRKVNDHRHSVLRDMLVLGCYRVEACVGYEEDPDSIWREPAWVVHGMDREEAIAFGRVFRQNVLVYCRNARPEVIVCDPTCDDVGRAFVGHFRVRA